MDALTPSERRGGLIVVLLLALGAAHDLWRASRPLPDPPAAQAVSVTVAGADSVVSPAPRAQVGSHPADALDLNRADVRELDALPGIGPVLAARIVAYRQRHGPFRSREELLGVRGIGPRLYARIESMVAAGSQAPGAAPGAAPTDP